MTTATAPGRHPGRDPADGTGEPGEFRARLLAGLAATIAESGYRASTVADIVRHARTSRRTFYAHFADKDACFVALLSGTNAVMIRQISSAVDPAAPWTDQVRQAVQAWVACAESSPSLTLSWIRDVPSLGSAARRLQRETMEDFITMIQTLCGTERWRAVRPTPVSRELAIMLLGGLRELTATTVEDGGQVRDITDLAVTATIALLAP